MAALSGNRRPPNILSFTEDFKTGVVVNIPVGALEEIYVGSFTSLDAGDFYLAPLAAGEAFAGLSEERVTGTASNGGITCQVRTGAIMEHLVGSVAVANIGDTVYASDDQTLTLVATSNSSVGRVLNVPAAGTAVVQCKMTGETLVQGAV